MPRDYYQDAQYQAAARGKVFQGKPHSSEGEDNEERWCWVNGEGLFLAKKYLNEWRFFTSSIELLEAGVISSQSNSSGGGSTSTGTGQFTTLSVSNSSSLSGSTGIAGTLSVTATALTEFPTTDNLKITSSTLDTAQPIQTTSAPQFNELGIGTAPSGEAGNIEVSSILGVSAPTFINNALFLYNTNYTNTSGTNLTDGLGLSSMTQAEATQLKNIDSSTISTDQWGYVGNMNQNVTTTSNVQLSQLTLKDTGSSLSGWVFNPDSDANLTIEQPGSPNRYIKFGSSNHDSVKLQSYNYTSGLFSGDGWGIFADGNRHKMEVDDLAVRGTLSVYELLIQQVRATNGSLFVTSASKLVDSDSIVHVSGSSPNEYVLNFETDSDNSKPHPFANGDLLLARRVEINGSNNNVVAQLRFTVTDITHGNANQLKATNDEFTGVGNLEVAGKTTNGANGFDFVRVGNTTDLNRQGGIYLTSDDTLSPFIDIFNEVSGWEQWDGITSAFNFNNGSFDGLTTTNNATTGWTDVVGSSWKARNNNYGQVSFPTTGGVTNDNYANIASGGGYSYIKQNITLPTITTGSYEFKISWYAKGDSGARVALQRSPSNDSYDDYFNASGTSVDKSTDGTINWINMNDISSPSDQPEVSSSWQRYEWDITVPYQKSTITDYHIMFTTIANTGKNLHLNNVRISLPNKVKTRIGNIEGVGASGYGLWGENVWLTGRITANSGYIGDESQGWEISSTGIKNASTSAFISSGQSTTGLDNGGIFLGGNGTFSAGASNTNGIKWDGNALTVRGAIHVTSAGSIDNSLVPNSGETIKLVAGGYNASTSSVGVFKVDTDGTITNQIGGSPSTNTASVTIMVWDPATNSLDTSFDFDGVYHNNTEAAAHTLFSGIANGKIVAILIHGNAHLTLNEASSSEVADIINDIKLIGGTTNVMNQTTVYGSYMCIGVKKSSAHTSGTEFAGTLAEDRTISLTVNLKDNLINILDSEGPLTDYDADGERKFIFTREDGFQMANIDLNSAYYRSFMNFIMPNINPEDASNVYIFFKSRNLTDAGNTNVRLYLNGNQIMDTEDLKDDDGTNQYVHEFHTIPAEHFKNDVGETNSFQFMMDADGTSNPMYVYHFELRSSTTGQTYSSGEIASPEGNLILNPGFEKDASGSSSATDWNISNASGGSFQVVSGVGNKMTGMQSLKMTNTTVSSSSHVSQYVPILGSNTYVLRFKAKWKNAITDQPTLSIHSADIDGSGNDGSLNIDSSGNHVWMNTKQWMSWSEILPNNDDANLIGQWVTYELKFTTPSSINGNTLASGQANTWKIWFYQGAQNSQEIWLDHVQFFKVEPSNELDTGLYMTGDRMGFYNGEGGYNGWASLIKDDGTFFFGSPYEPANLITPSSGGPYVRFTGKTLEVNANMVAGVIQSENLTATTGTKINLTDGSMITKGTDTSTGFVLDASGNLELNGATLDGGTITGQLFQTNYAEGDVNFVTSFTGASSSSYRNVVVNSVTRLRCNRVCDSSNMLFAVGTEQAANAYHTKLLEIWRYNDEQPPGGDADTALNRVAGPSTSTKITANMNSFPFLNFSWFTKNGESSTKECFAMRFRLEETSYHFYFRGGVRVDTTGIGDGGEVHMGYKSISSSQWSYLVSQTNFDDHPNDWTGGNTTSWSYNIFDRDGDGGADESDYFDANTIELTCGSYTVIIFGEVKHEQDGSTNQMTCTIKAFLTGTGVSMDDGSSTLTRVGVDLKKLNNGSYVTDRNVHFPEGFFRVYN